MKSGPHGKSTSPVEVLNVSTQGFGLSFSGRKLYLPFEEFPWFRHASLEVLKNVSLVSADHLYWPELDVDLSVESIEHPEKFPLISEPLPRYDATDSEKA